MREREVRPHRQYRQHQRPGRAVRSGQLRRREIGHPRLHQGAGAGRRAFGITVNAIAPGYVDTEMVRAVPADVLREDRRQDPDRPAGPCRGHRPRRGVPDRRRRRFHHRLDAVDQRRPAYVLSRAQPSDARINRRANPRVIQPASCALTLTWQPDRHADEGRHPRLFSRWKQPSRGYRAPGLRRCRLRPA